MDNAMAPLGRVGRRGASVGLNSNGMEKMAVLYSMEGWFL